VTARLAAQPRVEPEEVETEVGFHVQEITDATFRAQRLPSRAGAYVSFVASGSPAAEAGLDVGDVVRRIETSAVDDLASFRTAIERVASLPRFLVTVERGDETLFLLVRPGAPAREDAAPTTPGEAAHTR
jgi:serine protease Do